MSSRHVMASYILGMPNENHGTMKRLGGLFWRRKVLTVLSRCMEDCHKTFCAMLMGSFSKVLGHTQPLIPSKKVNNSFLNL